MSTQVRTRPHSLVRALRAFGLVLATAVSAAATGGVIGTAARSVSGHRSPPIATHVSAGGVRYCRCSRTTVHLPVTLGVIGMWTGVLAGLTAAWSGQLPARIWWPIHKIAAVSLVLVWLHGVYAGADSAALLVLYISTRGLVVALAVSRYTARTSADHVAEHAA